MLRAIATAIAVGLVLLACQASPATPSTESVPILVVNRLSQTVVLRASTVVNDLGMALDSVLAPCGGTRLVDASAVAGTGRSTALVAFIDPDGGLDELAAMASYDPSAIGDVGDLVIIWSDGTVPDDRQPHVVTIAPAGVEVTLGTTPVTPAAACGPWLVAPS